MIFIGVSVKDDFPVLCNAFSSIAVSSIFFSIAGFALSLDSGSWELLADDSLILLLAGSFSVMSVSTDAALTDCWLSLDIAERLKLRPLESF